MPWLHHQPLTLSEGPNTPRRCRCRGPRSPPRRRRRAPQRLLRASLGVPETKSFVKHSNNDDCLWLPLTSMCFFIWMIRNSDVWMMYKIIYLRLKFRFHWHKHMYGKPTICNYSRSCSLEKVSVSCRCVNPRVSGKRKQENAGSKGVGWTCGHPEIVGKK